MTPSPRENNWTIPNLLTLLRIMLTPGFVIAFSDQRFALAWVLFAVAGLTDALDGTLARLLKQRSTFGAMLDPLADKILLVTSFLCLAQQDWLPRWLAVLVVSRDVLIVGGLALLHYCGVDVKRGINPAWISKFTTLAQISLVLLVMVEHGMDSWHPVLHSGMVWTVATLTVLSGVHYLNVGLRMFPHGENGQQAKS